MVRVGYRLTRSHEGMSNAACGGDHRIRNSPMPRRSVAGLRSRTFVIWIASR